MNAGFVYALETRYPTILGMSIDNNSSFPEYAKYFFNIGMILAGILAVCVIAFGGIYYLVDFARGKFKDEGKEWIKAGVLGLLLTVSAYLIAYTINPYLVIFDLKGLAPLTFISNYFNPPLPSPPVEIYSEIPIGTLTEKLLSGAIDCYDFDGNGDPIPGDKITTDDNRTIYGPTYLDHDRVDCVLKLGQAAAKKAQIVKKLSDEITSLMNQCSCAGSTSNCDQDGKGCAVSGQGCAGSCVNGACKAPEGKKNTDCCPEGAKDKIEHGPIKIAGYDGVSEKEYKGLDEFRSQFGNNYALIKNRVEIQPPPKVNGKQITIINNGNCATCNFQCPVCDPKKKDYNTCLKNQQTCKKNEQICKDNLQKCLKQNSPWHNLRLIDQLIYLQGKIEEMKSKVKNDLDNLRKAESYLGQCYLADTYVDFLKTYEQTNKENKAILVERSFSDPETQQLINPAKYCQGFQYNNSDCYSQCQKVCPGTTQTDFNCYKNAPDCSKETDPAAKKNCLAKQAAYIKQNCYDKRECISDASPFSTFQGCMTGCKQQCLNSCDYKSGDDKSKCQQGCNDNSQCLLDNEDKCLVDFNQLKGCASENDLASKKECAENSAALCKYCSDQYSGYPDCLKSPYSLRDNYSASFIYQHPDYQICTYPYKIITINNQNNTTTNTTCLNLYPETDKCPATSKCPQCPCDIVNKTINYSLPPAPNPNSSCSKGSSSSSSSSSGGSSSSGDSSSGGIREIWGSGESSSSVGPAKKITEYRVCSANCDASVYNDDPLIFYCRQSWWFKEETKNTTPIGHEKICAKEREIPVGQTIDDAEKWANDFMDNIDSLTKKIESMIQYMKRIGQKTNYCTYDSKCENGKPVCHTDCQYNPPSSYADQEGKVIYVPPSCSFVPCSGNPCQLMIDLLVGATCSKACAVGNGIAYYSNQIDNAVKDFEVFSAKQNRSDIVKELSYSRQKTNDCSVVQNNYGTETRILSCTRVENEIISPTVDKYNKTIIGSKSFTSYCYGKSLGEILKTPEPMADNWFCCEDREKK